MDNVFRPSRASLQACETTSALHALVTRGITKEIQNIGEQVWSKFFWLSTITQSFKPYSMMRISRS